MCAIKRAVFLAVLAEFLQGAVFLEPFRNKPGDISVLNHEVSRTRRDTPWVSLSSEYTECGIKLDYAPLVANGGPVRRGEYPWLVALIYPVRNVLTYRCAGTLVSNKHIVTAAHCVSDVNKNKMQVVFGKNNIQNWFPNSTHRNIEKIIPHREYFNESIADVAVIIIDAPVTFSDLIRRICLWDEPIDVHFIRGKIGTVAGWGQDENGDYRLDARQIDIPIVDDGTCLRSHPNFNKLTSNRTFCAGRRDGKIPCRGDSGSGFVMNSGGRWKLRGVVSSALTVPGNEKLCDGSLYAVFTDVAQFGEWLDAILNEGQTQASSTPKTDLTKNERTGKKQPNLTQIKDASLSGQKCHEYSKPIGAPKCSSDDIPAVVGGTPAVAEEFPFMAAVGYENVQGVIKWECGGALISDKYVLIPGHCVKLTTLPYHVGPPKLVRLGEHHWKTPTGKAVDYGVVRMIVHPDYDTRTSYNDVALLELNATVEFTKWIRPACLWNRNAIEESTAITASWTSDPDPDYERKRGVLLKFKLNLISDPNTECGEKYNLPNGIVDSVLCASEPRKGIATCQGNSGGPLFIKRDGSQCMFYLIGVSSSDFYCSTVVYSRVSSYVKWIEETVW